MRTVRLSAGVLLVALVALLALPALAQEEGGDEGGTTETTVAGDESAVPVIEPAVPAPAPPADEVSQPWTSRFLVPTTLLLAAVAVIVTAVMYYVKVVRTRYRVVQ